MSFELTSFQLLTPGLYSGDPIKIRINFRVTASGFWRYSGWVTIIEGELNGQRAFYSLSSIGNHGGRDNVELEFTGLMPVRQHLSGRLIFRGFYNFDPLKKPLGTEFAQRAIQVANLDDAVEPPPPDPSPPVVCSEGQTRCKDYHLERCVNNRWVIEKYWADECGWTPTPPPEPPPPPPPPPPGPPPGPPAPPDEGIAGWFERNKKLIIGIAAAVIVIALVVMIAKVRVRSPVRAAPRFQKPVYRGK